jgi:hypothetical protein
MAIGILRSAQDFGCGLPLSRFAGSLTPAKRLNMQLHTIAKLVLGGK